jgi:protein-S-isoprenylcysteine O-methyltransferase Ste14
MDLLHRYLFSAMWWSWAAYWVVSSFYASAPKRVQTPAWRIAHLLAIVAVFSLLSDSRLGQGFLGRRLMPRTEMLFDCAALLTFLGLAFAVWARVHLGQYWSGSVTLKAGHRLIRTGPYALVRHPIYTGILLAVVGSALAVNEVRGWLAVAIVTATFVPKLRLEERWLTEEFGDEYRRYRREVKALIPGVI